MAAVISRRIVSSARPAELPHRRVQREFRRLLETGAELEPAGEAKEDPLCLLSIGYTPRYRVELFDTTFYLTNVRQNADIRFFVAYVVQTGDGHGARKIFPRIFYKDISLVWRSASHFARSHHENWIGKGEVKTVVDEGRKLELSDEATTDLPLEIQSALETLSRRLRRIRHDEAAIGLVLRRAPDDRIEPYRDFTGPRRRARAERRNLVNRGQSVARFTRKNDPTSLRFARGFEPAFEEGVLEISRSTSRIYGGALKRFRILSRNRKIQYLFVAGRWQVWIAACQATTTELSSFGVRTIDVVVDDDLLMPGYEYHFVDDLGPRPVLVSQIPEGFAGRPSEIDDSRADASPWLDRLPVIREFRRRLLSSRAGAGSRR